MKLLIDHADLGKIKELYDIFPIDGVTTNPTILAASGRPPFEVLKEIRAFIGAEADFHVQAIAKTAEGMVEDAHRIQKELGKNTYVKIPVNKEGLKAMKALAREGARFTGTAIYTALQGYLAGKAGAAYVAPYINRIDNLGADGVQTAKNIQDIFRQNDMPTQILAASFKNSQQVLALAEYGVGAATCAPDVINGLIKNASVEQAVQVFQDDFAKLVGEGKTMANL